MPVVRDVIYNLKAEVTGQGEADALAKTIGRSGAEYDSTTKKARSFEQEQRKVSQANQTVSSSSKVASAQVSTLGASVGSAAKNFLLFAGVDAGVRGLFRVIGSGLSTIADFDQAVADLSAITGATGGDLDFLKDKAIELGTVTTLTSTQVAEAFRIIASQRPQLLEDRDALSAVTAETIRLAEAAGSELPEAAKATASALNQFQLGSEEAARVVNALAAGSKFGAADIGSLGETIDRVGTVLDANNVSFETGIGLMETLGEREIKAGEAGTQLRNVILRLVKAGKGFSTGQFEVIEALEQVREEFAAIKDPVKRAEAELKLFEVRGITAGTILVENIDRIKEFTEKVTGTQTALEQQRTRVETVNNALNRLRSAYEGIVLSFGASSGALRKALDFLASNLVNIAKSVGLLVQAMVTYIVITRAGVVITAAWRAIQAAAVIVQAAFTGGLNRATAAMRLFNITTAANPIGLLVTVLATAVTAFYAFSDGAAEAAGAQESLNEAQRESIRLRRELNKTDRSIEDRVKASKKLNEEQLQSLASDIDQQIAEYERLAAGAIAAEEGQADKLDKLRKERRERLKELNEQIAAEQDQGRRFDLTLLRDQLLDEQNERRAVARATNQLISKDQAQANLDRLREQRATVDAQLAEFRRGAEGQLETLNTLEAKQKELQEALKDQAIGSPQFFAVLSELNRVEARIQAVKALLNGIVRGSLADLTAKRDELARRLRENLVAGSDAFSKTMEQYREAVEAVKRAEEALKLPDQVAPNGSIAFFEAQLKSLNEQVKQLPAGGEFDKLAAQIAEAERALKALRDRLDIEDPEEAAKRRRDANLAELSEEERHALAISDIDKDKVSSRLKLELFFAQERLRILREAGVLDEQEYTKQLNKVRELELAIKSATTEEGQKDIQTLTDNVITASATIATTLTQAFQSVAQSSSQLLDQQLEQQRQRVEEARSIADTGNAQLLNDERARLQELTEARRKAAEQQSLIAQTEVFANSAVAIARAASVGGPAAAITIASTVIALVAGLARARQLSSGLSFREGGQASWATALSAMGGYTGAGNPNQVSRAVGPKPYEYHRREFIMPHEVVSVGDNLQWMERIHRGRLDIGSMLAGRKSAERKSSAPGYSALLGAMKKAPGVNVRLDRNGFSVFLSNAQRRHARTMRRR